MGYKLQAFQGFSWHSLFKFSSTALVAIKLFVLARILTPTDFGLFSLVTIALGITEAFTETGINVILIQTKRSFKYFLDTAWVIAILRGLVIAIIMIVLALLMNKFYQEPSLLPLITLASFVPLLKGFINPSIIIMQKEMKFWQDSIYRISLSIVEVTSAIILALIFHSVYVLVFSMIIAALFEVIISFVFFKQRPVFSFNQTRAEEIFSQSKWLNITAILSYLHENLDNLIIGKLTTTTSLGYYHNAYAMANKPNYHLSQSVSHSTLPIFSKISHNKRRLKTAYKDSTLYSMGLFSLLSLPFLIYPQIVVLFLGAEWQGSVVLIRPLILAGLLQAFSGLNYSYYYSLKKYKLINSHLFLITALMVMLLIYMIPKFGLAGAGWAIFLSRLIALPVIILPILKKKQ